jgi:aerotaxis receptor
LRAVLVKVVRTSTEEADRRRWPRVKCSLPIKVNCRGRLQSNAMLADISEGGAWIRGVPELDLGETGHMTVQGFDADLPFTVRSQGTEAIHVEFDLGHRRDAYHRWFDANLRTQAGLIERRRRIARRWR